MKIRELSVKNCLSFCDKGLNKDNSIQLSDFSLFIGSNNAGKSNILRLVELIGHVLESVRNGGNDLLENIPMDKHLGVKPRDWLFAQGPHDRIDFAFSLELERVDQSTLQIHSEIDPRRGDPVFLMLALKAAWPKVVRVAGFIDYGSGPASLTINRVEIPNDAPEYANAPSLFDKNAGKTLALTP
jgi:hypothetical protein